ncbi:molybdate ABC transporter substrate-binding protein [Cohnella lupini]|uniref:Molybdate transport system substrate-binding protein n=1 Tax=Cohnella lupini TaxID=1294267 RepID=A0A3D9IAI0_9BACL|nr:molybdate ABC transporter substrate-binding protein [Cohnella lupini]RED58645.1 molybdate transport system substrate-binding protein [Cohnella lupini]
MKLIDNTNLPAAIAIILLITTIGCGRIDSESSSRTEILVSAAASLTDSLYEIESRYEKDHPDIDIVYNFGSSGALQQQIEQGAPADLFLSAGTKQMRALVDNQLVDAANQIGLLRNELVVIVPTDSKNTIDSIGRLAEPEFIKLAIGEPDTVPAGSYAKESLERAEVWDRLLPKFVYAKDVRQVLTYVETGNADAGFVYKTDAMTSKKSRIAFIMDSDSHSPIEYPLGIVKATKHPKEAESFYAFLQSDDAHEIFAEYGFGIPSAE